MFSRLAKLFQDTPQTESDINLLLLGETGVGKSTFINSISNYFKHPSFKNAKKAKMEVLIPVRINLANGKKIYGNPDENELHENGAACTQQVKIYLFPITLNDGRVINLTLVDTPGVGDPRGMDQDNTNLDNILAYLATLKKLHGICFILKSNQTRFTKFIEYCLKQILTRLDKSASENIIFITTYSKTAQYTAGETMEHCLEPLVQNIKSKPPHVTIPLNKQNVFSVDNEAFKALLEIQQGKKFKSHELAGLAESWNVSNRECRRLLTYIVGNSKTPPIKPHEVESTVSVNEVRFLIEQLATPIAEVSDVIQDNLRLLDRHQKNLNLETQSLSQLKEQLFIPCVDLQVKELDQPVTVCTDAKCADIVKVNEVTKWHYRQKCHNPCFLSGIPKEIIGDPGLVSCAAMNGSETCNECGCHWQVHMHIYKTTEKIDIKREDDNVKDAIKNKEDVRVQIETHIKTLNQRRQELERESEVISESIAKFSYFLQEHALTPFNDAYSDYIQHLIKNEKSLGKFADPGVIEKLQKLLAKHEHLQKIFQENTQKFESAYGSFDLSPQSIKNSITELYGLKLMGKKIQELIQKTSACRLKETQKNFSCVVSQQINLRESWKYQQKMDSEEYKDEEFKQKSHNDEIEAASVGSDNNNSDSDYKVSVDYKFYENKSDSDGSNTTGRSEKSSKGSSKHCSNDKKKSSKKQQESVEEKTIKASNRTGKSRSKSTYDSDDDLRVYSSKNHRYGRKLASCQKFEADGKSTKLSKAKGNHRNDNEEMQRRGSKTSKVNKAEESIKKQVKNRTVKKQEKHGKSLGKEASNYSEEDDEEVTQSGSDEDSQNIDSLKKYRKDDQGEKFSYQDSDDEEEDNTDESESENSNSSSDTLKNPKRVSKYSEKDEAEKSGSEEDQNSFYRKHAEEVESPKIRNKKSSKRGGKRPSWEE